MEDNQQPTTNGAATPMFAPDVAPPTQVPVSVATPTETVPQPPISAQVPDAAPAAPAMPTSEIQHHLPQYPHL